MTKRRKKIIIIAAIIAVLVAITAAVSLVFAYSVLVDYNYNSRAYSCAVEVSTAGNTLTVTRGGDELIATHADIIVDSDADDITLSGTAPALSVDLGDGIFRLVFKDMALSSGTTLFSLSGGTGYAARRAAVTRATHTLGGSLKTVEYENIYAAEAFDLYRLNFSNKYNSLSELWSNYNNDIVKARVLFVLNDMTVAEPASINHSCSIDLLDSTLTLDADITIHHSFAGAYYLKSEGEILGDGQIVIETPKAFYSLDAGLTTHVSVSDYGTAYQEALLAEALAYGVAALPDSTYSNIILQSKYQSYGIQLDYSVSGQPFSGRVTEATGVAGAIVRTGLTADHTVTVTASLGDKSVSQTKAIKVIGNTNSAIQRYVADVVAARFAASSGQSNVEIAPLLTEALANGHVGTLDVSVSETGVLTTDENATKIYINGGTPSDAFTFSYTRAGGLMAGVTAVNSVCIARGTLVISEAVTLKVGTVSQSIALGASIREELEYYLKSNVPVSSGSTTMAVYNMAAGKLRLGTAALSAYDFGITNVKYGMFLLGDDETLEVSVSDYFTVNATDFTITLGEGIKIPNNFYMYYTFTFDDTTEFTFNFRIVFYDKDESGENQLFESNNPFDELFMSSSTNWLEGGTFRVSIGKVNYFAKIEIITVDGETYNYANTAHKLCYIVNSGTNHENTYFKNVQFVTDRAYVPDHNTLVKVRCTYYDRSLGGSILVRQDYSVVIPGVFKCEGTVDNNVTPYFFTDHNFYDMTMDAFNVIFPDKRYVSTISSGQRFLLSDTAYVTQEINYADSAVVKPGVPVNVKGIEKLISTKSIVFDGVALGNISAFSLMSHSVVENLSMVGCGLTDAIMFGSTAGHLYEVHFKTVDLSYNNITKTEKMLSRTVEDLVFTHQTNLTVIDGLTNLINIQTLDVSNNSIQSFEPLRELKTLKEVWLYNNLINSARIEYAYDGAYTLYGTDGLINIPHYGEIIRAFGVKIYASETLPTKYIQTLSTASAILSFSVGGDIQPSMVEGNTALNAFVAPTVIASAQMETAIAAALASLSADTQNGYTFEFFDIVSGGSGTSFHYSIEPTGVIGAKRGAYTVVVKKGAEVLMFRQFLVTVTYS